MNRFIKFLKLRRAEKALLLEAFALVALVRLALWVVPFGWLKRLMRRLAAAPPANAPDWPALGRIVRAVKTAGEIVPAASCLTQALAALVLIRLKGEHSELRIGVAKGADEKFRAHAWLETGGRIIIGKLPGHNEYVVLH